mgnify:CR=1 FL=1
MLNDERRRRRGPGTLDPQEKREHCVSVRVNARELAQLDERRGNFQRGEWLRMAALDKLPPTVPSINSQAWAELARAAANLNQLAKAVNAGARVEKGGLRDQLNEFRAALIGAKLDDEGHAED